MLLDLLAFAQTVPDAVPPTPPGAKDWISLLSSLGTPGVAGVVLVIIIRKVADWLTSERDAQAKHFDKMADQNMAFVGKVTDQMGETVEGMQVTAETLRSVSETNLQVTHQTRELLREVKAMRPTNHPGD